MTRISRLTGLTAAVLAAGALAACENRSNVNAEPETAPTVGDGSTDAGSQLQEEAVQIGEALEAGAKEVAQEIDQTTDRLAEEAEEAEADTAAEAAQDNAGKR